MTARLDDAVRKLMGSPLCHNVDPEAAATLWRRATVVDKLRGEAVFGEGQPATTLYLVVRGIIKLLRPLDRGRDVIVELVGPGDLIGEAALTDDGVYSTRAVCVHPSTVVALPREDVISFVHGDPAATRNVLKLMDECVRRARSRIEDMAVFGVRQRIVRFLIRLADWGGRQENGKVVVPLALSRQEIAELVGTTMETAIRVMSSLRHEGLVLPARRGVVLTDRAALEQMAAREP